MSRAASLAGVTSVLVVKPSSLGDIVHTLPAVHLLKRAHPHLRIRWLANSEWAPLLAENPDLEGIVLFPRREFSGIRGLWKLRGWLWKLSRTKPDLALDFQGLARSALIARLSGARAIHCLGDAEVTARLLSHRVVPVIRSKEHSVTRYLKLVVDLGIDPQGPLEFPLPAGEKPAGVDFPERFLLLHPFSRGENKSLSPACLDRLFQALAPMRIVLAGRSQIEFKMPANGVNLLNRTSLSELIWLIRHAHFTVSVDSGPMHIAAAITSRVLGIHTWSNPLLVGPCNDGAWVWKNGALMQVRDLTPENAGGSLSFDLEHVAQMADFLKSKFATGSP